MRLRMVGFMALVIFLGANGSVNAAGFAGSFVKLQHGTFSMGSPVSEQGRSIGENAHSVTLTQDFEMQTTVVTQSQWFDTMGTNPSTFNTAQNCSDFKVVGGVGLCPNLPVESVSWTDVQAFLVKLNATAMDGHTYRLPTEAEWEYAARGGTRTAFSFGNNETLLDQYAWWGANTFDLQTHPVGGKQPNPYGLFDIHGNVWQWVQDWYGAYPSGAVVDPLGAATGWGRVFRGGYFYADGVHCRSAGRYSVDANYRGKSTGFRLVR
jgi:formylglycine-generating enzyme required for sulfatase activity